MSQIQKLHSVKVIEQKFLTGEEPVLVRCSDRNAYICKYAQSTQAAYKMVCELIGASMAQAWHLNTPDVAFVNIHPDHWVGTFLRHNVSAPAFGSLRLDNVADITPSTFMQVKPSGNVLMQLLHIALFDFWIANEDRNANNANLLYDMENDRLVSIDYGCILNTATFDYPMSQLTSTDTILWSDLFQHISAKTSHKELTEMTKILRRTYDEHLQQAMLAMQSVVDNLPKEWHVGEESVSEKLSQLSDKSWTQAVWENFMDNLNDNTKQNKDEV